MQLLGSAPLFLQTSSAATESAADLTERQRHCRFGHLLIIQTTSCSKIIDLLQDSYVSRFALMQQRFERFSGPVAACH
jgi:hypothetical protein